MIVKLKKTCYDMKMNCKYCHADESYLIKFGKQKGLQRYRCKNCGKTFVNSGNIKYERRTRSVVSLLLNLLKNDFFNKNKLDEAIAISTNFSENVKKIKFDTSYSTKQGNFDINCFNPKLLICEDDKNIIFIKVPTGNLKPNPYQIEKIKEEHRTDQRKITILDSLGYANLLKSESDKYTNYL